MDKTDLPDLIRVFIDQVDGHVYQVGNYTKHAAELSDLTRRGLKGSGMDDMLTNNNDLRAEILNSQQAVCCAIKKVASLIGPSKAITRNLLAFHVAVDTEPTVGGHDTMRAAWENLKPELQVIVLQGSMLEDDGDSPPVDKPPAVAGQSQYALKEEAGTWTVRFEGKQAQFTDGPGALADIHHILTEYSQNPDSKIDIFDLPRNKDRLRDGPQEKADGDKAALQKAKAADRSEYSKSLKGIYDLEQEIKEIQDSSNPARLAELPETEEELANLQKIHNANFGKGGKRRDMGSESAKAVDATKKRIQRLRKKLLSDKVGLGCLADHLDSLDIGETCQYKPGVKIPWDL